MSVAKTRKIRVVLGVLAVLVVAGSAPEASAADAGREGDLWKIVSLYSYNSRLVILATMLLGVTSGLVGVFLLLRKRSLMGDALSHATYPGIGLAFLVMISLGEEGKWLPGLLIGAAITGVIGVTLVSVITKTTPLKDDAAILHPVKSLTLEEAVEYVVDGEFVALVRTAECGGVPTLRPIAEGVFALPVFTRRFCTLLCEELAHFAASGLPMGP